MRETCGHPRLAGRLRKGYHQRLLVNGHATSTSAAVSQSDPIDETKCASYLKAVGDPLRIRIVRALQIGPLSVSDLAESLEQEIGVVSHHLRVLFHADVVQTRREGKYIYYSLSNHLLGNAKRTKNRVLDFGCCSLDVGSPAAE